MDQIHAEIPLFVDVARALLACMAAGSLLAKRMFPSPTPSRFGTIAGFVLAGSGILVVAPANAVASALGAAGISCVVAIGWLLALRRAPTERCDCFGSLTPPGRLFPTLMLVAAGGCAIVVLQFLPAHPGSAGGWLPTIFAIVGTCLLALWFKVLKYRRAFYSPGKLEGTPPEELAPETILGSSSGRALGIDEVLGGSDVAIVVLLSSACASCRALLDGLLGSLRTERSTFNVAFVSNHARIFSGVVPPPGAYFVVDEHMATARTVLATKLPVSFAINDQRQLLAPPSTGSNEIISLFSFVQAAKSSS